jgi:peptidyl-prolyl cis-trans isomerase C
MVAGLAIVPIVGMRFPSVAAAPLVEGPGFSITSTLVDAELAYMPRALAYQTRGDPARLTELINDLYRREAIVQAAETAGVDKDPRWEYRLQRARKEALVAIMLDREREHAAQQVPDFTPRAEELYRANKAEYRVPEEVHVRHILLRAASNREKAARRPEAEAILERLKSGEDFATLAKAVSEDPGSAQRGGDLGEVRRGRMVKPFEDAAFALEEPGDLSGIVETRYGLHIILLVARQEARQRSFDEVKQAIVKKLQSEYIEGEVEAWRRSVVDPKRATVDQDAVHRFIERTVKAHEEQAAKEMTAVTREPQLK